MSSKSNLTFCGNLAYSTWREADESTPFVLEEHEEQLCQVSILVRYILKTEQQSIVTERTLTLQSEQMIDMIVYDDFKELGIMIGKALEELGVGKSNTNAARERIVNDYELMEGICEEAVGYCRCYCNLLTGPTIVMEIDELLDGNNAPPALDD